jgi:hypothetical protein
VQCNCITKLPTCVLMHARTDHNIIQL